MFVKLPGGTVPHQHPHLLTPPNVGGGKSSPPSPENLRKRGILAKDVDALIWDFSQKEDDFMGPGVSWFWCVFGGRAAAVGLDEQQQHPYVTGLTLGVVFRKRVGFIFVCAFYTLFWVWVNEKKQAKTTTCRFVFLLSFFFVFYLYWAKK